MNHAFIASQTDKRSCAICSYGYLSHTKAAQCESCNKVGPCEIVDKILMCDLCQALSQGKSEQALQFARDNNIPVVMIETKKEPIDELIEANEKLVKDLDPIRDVLNDSRALDSSIRYNGDVFNAETIAHVELKKAIWAIPDLTEDQKYFKYHSELAERYKKFKQVVFEADESKFKATTALMSISHTLRDEKNRMAAEVSAKFKALDAQYELVTPPKKVKADVPKKPKKSPFDMLVEQYALMHNCTVTEAVLAIRKIKPED